MKQNTPVVYNLDLSQNVQISTDNSDFVTIDQNTMLIKIILSDNNIIYKYTNNIGDIFKISNSYDRWEYIHDS